VNLKHALLRFGLTATPDRADGCDLLIEAACGDTLYSYAAPEAIKDGYLARPEFIMYSVQQTHGTFKKWKTEKKKRVLKGLEQACSNSKKADTDAMVAYKHWVLGNDMLNDSVAAMARDCAAMGKSVLILVDEKEHGEKLSERLQGVVHEFVHGERLDVEDVVEQFNLRKIPILIGTTVIGEGTDTIPVDVMFNLLGNTRPKQAIGRALRNENGLKPKCLIIDFFFPNCSILDRHSSMREEVYREYGRVDRENLL
jgi:superfamily II DNA or RNA helicase